ncbi:MAG TPA: murein L,D-transpeptidase catalytic domain family protein [Ferruginibacter sp.]|nr:murein L,D-transpeptidase catalytic domain family protein [Ferruginibacter sp.]
MKLIIRSIILFFLLVVSIDTIAGAFQQPGNSLAKGPSINIVPVSSNLVSEHVVNENNTILTVTDSSFHHIETKYKAAVSRLKQQAASLENYIKANNYNSEFVFLVDMSLPSGKNRFFVYNLKKDALETSSLVTHGVGSNRYENDDPLKFSNSPDSKMTSIGKYKIGKSYYGRFGLAYKLYGLESTNDKAFERDIVLHAHAQVPEKEPFPGYIIVSSGCPTVAPAFLATLDKYIRASKKPILLWVYN